MPEAIHETIIIELYSLLSLHDIRRTISLALVRAVGAWRA